MAKNIDAPSLVRDVAELMKANRRVGGAVAASQVLTPAKDRLVIATNGQPATWQLSALPDIGDLGSSLNLSLNGVELDEAADYSVDYTTGLVTFSSAQQALFKVTPAPADVLTADYLTSDDLIAQAQPPDTGGGDPTPPGFTGMSVSSGSGGRGYSIWSWLDGVPTNRASTALDVWPVNGTLSINRSGSVYTAKIGTTTILTWTDVSGGAFWGSVVGMFLGPANSPTSLDNFAAGSFTDAFTRSNGDVGNSWTVSTPAPQIVSNAIVPPTGTSTSAWMLRDISTAPSSVQVDVIGSGSLGSPTAADYFHVACGTGAFV